MPRTIRRQRNRAVLVATAVLTLAALGAGCAAPATLTPRPSRVPAAASGTMPAVSPRGEAPSASSPSASPLGDASFPAAPSPTAPPLPPQLTSEALRQAVGAREIRSGLEDIQGIAAAHGGNRAAGTSGYDASVAYVTERLQAAGYRVEQQPFAFTLGTQRIASVNVLAERPGRDPARVLMLGAHLDSVTDRAGINDNGSGSMTLLVLAERLADMAPPDATVRFAFWGAEEPGLFGSTAYVARLSPEERESLVAYLNFDMLGSPNHVRFVYADRVAPPGSEALTDVFADYFESVGLAWDTFDLTGKSDHAPFSRAGIPTGGLFSGGRELKTDAQAAAFGGTPGVPADACNDAACDTTANVSDVALDEMADAAAHALVVMSASDGES